MNGISEPKTNVLPSTCNNCKHLVGRTPAWLRLLDAMSPGSGRNAVPVVYTRSAIARGAGMHRQQVDAIIEKAISGGLVQEAAGVSGARVYRKTPYGQVVLSRWKAAGWKAAPLGKRWLQRKAK